VRWDNIDLTTGRLGGAGLSTGIRASDGPVKHCAMLLREAPTCQDKLVTKPTGVAC
jgi:hypothetical protein